MCLVGCRPGRVGMEFTEIFLVGMKYKVSAVACVPIANCDLRYFKMDTLLYVEGLLQACSGNTMQNEFVHQQSYFCPSRS